MCGIVGIIGNHHVASTIYECLTILQHRGQDAAGIATCHDDRLELVKNNGLVSDVFKSESAKNYKVIMALAMSDTQQLVPAIMKNRNPFM